MAGSHSTGSALSPLFLRVALGVTFLWAGFGKVLNSMPVECATAAVLANMGVIQPTSAPPASSTPAKPPQPADVASPPKAAPPAKDTPAPKPLMALEDPPAPDKAPPADAPAPTYTASDFPKPVDVRAVYGIALLLHQSANPPAADGKQLMPLVPAMIGAERYPVYLAWAAALTELLGGLFVLVGLFTRLSALLLAGTMATAMWLTKIGPAIQSGDTLLGFLPNHPAYAFDAAGNYVHTVLLWQFALLCACLSLLFAGAGAMSFDRALMPQLGRREEPHA